MFENIEHSTNNFNKAIRNITFKLCFFEKIKKLGTRSGKPSNLESIEKIGNKFHNISISIDRSYFIKDIFIFTQEFHICL